MRCVDSYNTDVYFQLAAEEYLLKHTRENYFLVWQAEPTVVLGRHQSVHAEVDLQEVGRRGIRLARRFSGGGAVYQDRGNLNLTFIETVDRPVFERYLQAVVAFLDTLGVELQTDSRMGIYLGGKKVSGSAQSVYKDRILYHCTLLFDTDLKVLESALRGDGQVETGAVASVRSPVTNIRARLRRESGPESFREQLLRYFLLVDPSNCPYTLGDEDRAAIIRLKEGKYATPEWIYRKS